jgi:hypothetical protein
MQKKGLRQMKAGIARRLCFGIVQCGAVLSCVSQVAFAAGPITGLVRNATSGQPAAGDEVILLRLDRNPHEEARTKIDAQGGFTFNLPDPDHPHIIRVIHHGVNYEKPVTAAGPISIDVFDAAAKVEGVTGGIEIIRAGTRGSALHVSDMVEIWNQSNPPVTQVSARSFEVYLPAGAMIDSVLAAGPDNIAASVSAMLVPGEPGHYSVNFPVLPGATKFAFNYDLPYNGHATLSTKSVYSFKQVAIMIPPTMAFASPSSAFQALPVGTDRYHVEAAENVRAGATLKFEISGAGELPEAHRQSPTAANPPAEAPAPEPSAIAAGVSQVVNTAPRARKIATHSSAGWWWVLGTAVICFAVCVFFAWRRQSLRRRRAASVVQLRSHWLPSAAPLVDALKEGLFQLESDRMQGAICSEDYTSAKRALEGTIQWALTRAQHRNADAPIQ